MYQIFSWAPLGEQISRHLSDCAITADGFHHLMSAIEDSNLCSDFPTSKKKNEGAFCSCEQWGVGWGFAPPKNDSSGNLFGQFCAPSFVFHWFPHLGGTGQGIHVPMSAFQIKVGKVRGNSLSSDKLIDQCRMAGADNA